MASKPVVIEEVHVVEANQLLKNANNLLEPSTISTDKVELIELPQDSKLLTGFRFIDLSILSDVWHLLAYPNSSTADTLKLHDIKDEIKRTGEIYAS